MLRLPLSNWLTNLLFTLVCTACLLGKKIATQINICYFFLCGKNKSMPISIRFQLSAMDFCWQISSAPPEFNDCVLFACAKSSEKSLSTGSVLVFPSFRYIIEKKIRGIIMINQNKYRELKHAKSIGFFRLKFLL